MSKPKLGQWQKGRPPKVLREIVPVPVADYDQCLSYIALQSDQKSMLRDYVMIMFMGDCGLRISELRAIRIGDLQNQYEVAHSVVIRDEDAKYGSGRTVPLPRRLQEAIGNFLKDKAYTWDEPDDMAFYSPRSKSKPMTARAIQKIVEKWFTKSIGKHVHPHQLRHTYATQLSKVASMPVVQKALGHRSISTTAIYTSPNADDVREAVDKLPFK